MKIQPLVRMRNFVVQGESQLLFVEDEENLPLDALLSATTTTTRAKSSAASLAAAAPISPDVAHYALIIDAGSSGSRIYVYNYKLPLRKPVVVQQHLKRMRKQQQQQQREHAAAAAATGTTSSPTTRTTTATTDESLFLSEEEELLASLKAAVPDPSADLLHVMIAPNLDPSAKPGSLLIRKSEPGMYARTRNTTKHSFTYLHTHMPHTHTR